MGERPLLALVGPTASGKSEAAIQIADVLGAEIVSVDSMLVYRGMDVGTAKPSPSGRARVPHHMIDVAEPSEPFSVARYQVIATRAVEGIRARGARVLLAGGSGLYFRAVADRLEFPATDPAARRELELAAAALGPVPLYARLERLDPDAAARIEPGNVRRTVRALEVPAATGRLFSSFAHAWNSYPRGGVRAAGVELPREALDLRIRARVAGMLRSGLLEEVGTLLERGLFGWLTASQAIGYAEFARHLRAELSLDDAIERTVKRTRGLARRQLAWFRRDPRIRWFAVDQRGASAIVEPLTRYLRDG
jgi:tRNA dimethylallyltransferase